jgi:hypothetical protein
MVTPLRTALVCGLLLASGMRASGQIRTPPINPALLPDLTVSLNTPAATDAYTLTMLTIKVDNQAPTLAGITGSSMTSVRGDLTGLVPQVIQSASGHLTCSFWAPSATPSSDWNQVFCSGNIAYGDTETIYVWVMPSTSFYCGRPTYTDFAVASSARERSTANNRAIARTDLTNCIG